MAVSADNQEYKLEVLRRMFNGRVIRIVRSVDRAVGGYYLSLVIHVPDDGSMDELEVYRRLHTVVNTISPEQTKGA